MTPNIFHISLLILRILFFSFSLCALNQVFPLGSNNLLLGVSATLGCLAGFVLSRRRLKFLGVAVLVLALALALQIFLWLGTFAVSSLFAKIFQPHALQLHIWLAYATVSLTLFSTWGTFNKKSIARPWVTAELLLLVLGVLFLFAGHQEFHFDTPKVISEVAWNLRMGNLVVILGIGACLLLVVCFYAWLSEYCHSSEEESHHGRPDLMVTPFVVVGVIFVLGKALYSIHGYYFLESQVRLANGVTQNTGEGLSPLEFNSALGATNQPAALLRLEGDYKDNPFAPMLYMREAALSEFNGIKMVGSDQRFDTDVNNTRPTQGFQRDEDLELPGRVPVTQSLYLLAEHKLAFAVDYPLRITPLVNPKPERFFSTFKAYSVAPAFALKDIELDQLGDPRWDQETWQHYTKTHPDGRYHLLANEVTAGREQPLAKAFAITDYLSKTTIYTLQPKHQVARDEDQTAPYLFGDKRGYCVHFAHAMVYLFRSLGIPARIATGYLTDLREAKDGHVLLRMSDRHAWAEIYVRGKGWIPFDIQPAQVESQADSQVDMQTLEELMDLLSPDQEILPKDAEKSEARMRDKSGLWIPSRQQLVFCLALIIIGFLLSKLFLRYSHLLPANPKRKIWRAYRSNASRLADLGYVRSEAETREIFSARISNEMGIPDIKILSQVLNHAKYCAALDPLFVKQAHSSVSASCVAMQQLPLHKKVFSWLNPRSLVFRI